MSLRAALGVPVARLLDLTSRCSARQAGVVICHHRVDDPQEDPDAYLVAAMGTKLFEAQLRHLKRRYRVVPPSEILDAVRARRRGQRFPVAITFDDDLPTHLPTAVPIMKRMGVPVLLPDRGLDGGAVSVLVGAARRRAQPALAVRGGAPGLAFASVAL